MTSFLQRQQLLYMPFDLLLKVSEHLSFSDLWYMSSCSQHCRKLGNQLILHKYHIDLSRAELNSYCYLIYGALAYASQHGYRENKTDLTVLQSVANRLAVEIFDRSSLSNWEACLDFLLDETLRIVVDHVFLDTRLDIISNGTSEKKPQSQKMRKLAAEFINALYTTLTALFETEATSQIHHRLLLNHINRHLCHISAKYHQHYYRRLYTDSSSSAKNSVILAFRQHNLLLRSNFRILVRFIGSLVQSELLSIIDLDILTRQRIQFFFLRNEIQDRYPKKKKQKTDSLTYADYQLQLEENDFKMEIFLDLTRAALLLQQHMPPNNGLNSFSNMLHDTVSNLISTKKSSNRTFVSSATSV
ncbi:hypothetical protein BY458DRAFT_515791 [Sporodiniella umbellata]|nr:hypothetical protein BY458DRAFT_515791 [Sporodiniella umbellata]